MRFGLCGLLGILNMFGMASCYVCSVWSEMLCDMCCSERSEVSVKSVFWKLCCLKCMCMMRVLKFMCVLNVLKFVCGM